MCVREADFQFFCSASKFREWRTCTRGAKFEVFWSAGVDFCGEHAPANQIFNFLLGGAGFLLGEHAPASRKIKKIPFFFALPATFQSLTFS